MKEKLKLMSFMIKLKL